MMMDLVKQDLRGVGISYCLDLFGHDIFALGRKIRVEMNVGVYHAEVGDGVSLGREMVARRRFGLDAIILASWFHGLCAVTE